MNNMMHQDEPVKTTPTTYTFPTRDPIAIIIERVGELDDNGVNILYNIMTTLNEDGNFYTEELQALHDATVEMKKARFIANWNHNKKWYVRLWKRLTKQA